MGIVAVESLGRSWEKISASSLDLGVGKCQIATVRDVDKPGDIRIFKRPPVGAGADEIYSIAIERIAYVLGRLIGLPIPGVQLVEIDEEKGCLIEPIPDSMNWAAFNALHTKPTLKPTNVEDFCLIAAFDIWTANCDRARRNILVKSEPDGTPLDEAEQCSFIPIDHGSAGLWPPEKLGEGITSIEEGELPGADLRKQELVRDEMAKEVWACYRNDEDARRRSIELIQSLGDAVIEQPVGEVPECFMTAQEKEMTAKVLKSRRDRLDTLSEALLR